MAGTLTVTGMAAGLASGWKWFGPVSMTGVSTVGQLIDAQLAVGDNTFALPAGETLCAVAVFLGTTSATVKLRTSLDASDAGVTIAPYVGAGVPWCVLPLPSGAVAVILNASAIVPGVELSYI